jgi:hypothetical protein
MNALLRGRWEQSEQRISHRHLGEFGKRARPTRQRAEELRREYKMPHGDDTNGPDGTDTPEAAAHYIAALAGQLAEIARRNGLDTLSAILEMARLEADQATKR